jgi:hypothetical protein
MYTRLIFLLVFLTGINYQSFAQGDLLVTPTRVVFEGRKQVESIYLVNMGKETTTYSVSFLQYDQNEDGSYAILDAASDDKMFADPYLRIYPRTVTLAPSESQVIKLQCRLKPGMLDGEYRSHLYFRSEKNYTALGYEKTDTIKTISVKLTPIYGISIPVIIRSGDLNAAAIFSDLKIAKEDLETKLNFTINRSGNKSIYGNLAAEYVPVEGRPYQIGVLNSVAVYTNINKRNFSLLLNLSPGTKLNTGKVRLRFSSSNDAKNQGIFAETELELK